MFKIIIFVSFFLDGLLSFYQGDSVFYILSLRPMFTIVSLVLICPFLTKDKYRYYRLCGLTGLAYDLVYTNTLVLNMLLFVLIAVILERIYSYFSDTVVNSILINIFVIALYHILTFIILGLIGYHSFSIITLSSGLFSIIITNTIFFIIVYVIIQALQGKYRRKSKYSL